MGQLVPLQPGEGDDGLLVCAVRAAHHRLRHGGVDP